jgi:hypothetical protein
MKNLREDQLQHKGRKRELRYEAGHLNKRTYLLKNFPITVSKNFYIIMLINIITGYIITWKNGNTS